MGFGGAHTMGVVLKNNRNLLRKRKKFQKSIGGYDNSIKTEYTFPKATRNGLNQIKNRLQREQKERIKKRVVVFTVLITILCCTIVYLVGLS